MQNNLDKQYLNLLQDILDNGVIKNDRTGTGSISVFGREIRHKMSEGFPLLTTKKIAFSQVKSELAWFLAGSSDIRLLWKYNNHIWDGDCYKKYVNNNQFNSNPKWLLGGARRRCSLPRTSYRMGACTSSLAIRPRN